MGEHVIKLPDVGEGVAEAELVEWHVKVGDIVREDTVLAAVMTDKATVEIPSPVDGEILWLGAEIGDTVAIGSPIVRLKVAGEGNAKPQSGDAVEAVAAEAPARLPTPKPEAVAPTARTPPKASATDVKPGAAVSKNAQQPSPVMCFTAARPWPSRSCPPNPHPDRAADPWPLCAGSHSRCRAGRTPLAPGASALGPARAYGTRVRRRH